ncbi:MAG: hypothetical protein H6744_15180 [Deltaproteobacteria bacterium]|nr:hypothetical protein [Deltaproteobacteria bacterium]
MRRGARRAEAAWDAPVLAAIILLCAGLGCACAPRATLGGPQRGPDAPDAVWRLEADAALSRLSVRACFADPPEVLVPGSPRASRWLVGAVLAPRGSALRVDGDSGAIDLSEAGAGACVDYTIDLAALLAAGSGGHGARRSAASAFIDPDLLLWRPRDLPRGYRGRVRFVLPEGLSASSPWPVADDGSRVLDATAFDGTARIAVGRLSRFTVPSKRGPMEVAVLDGERAATDRGIQRWLEASAAANALVFGATDPTPAQVLVIPSPDGDDSPVRFGMAMRGGGAGLLLLLDPRAHDPALPGEWIAIHELFHLEMPAIRKDDAWLSEGVTMYYSEVLRARAGFLTATEAWQRLHEGFGRGRRGGTGRSLAEESRAMGSSHAYMRVYWGGAAIALAWDVALREASGGRRSLDDAMRHLQACCRVHGRFWSAAELVEALDDWWEAPLFSRIAEPWLESQDFPDLAPLRAELGLELSDGGDRVRPVPARLSPIRDAITARVPPGAEHRPGDAP